MVAAALIGGAATLVGSAVSANASRKATNKAVAADASANAQNTALIREQMGRADAATAPLTPYAAAGAARLASRLGIVASPTNALQSGNAYAPPGADIRAANYYSPSGQPMRTPYDTPPPPGGDYIGANALQAGNAYAAAPTGATRMDEGTGGGVGYYNPNGAAAYSAQPQTGTGGTNALQAGYGASDYLAGSALSTAAQPVGNAYGNTANPTYQDPAAFKYTAADYQESPGFQFRLERGLDAIQSSQAARGAMYSGATGKAIAKFAEGLAAQDFGNERNFAYQDYTNTNNRLRANYDADRGYLTNRYDRETGDILNLTGIGQQAVNQQLGQSASGTNALIQGNNQTASTVGNAAFANANATTGLVNSALQAGGNIMGAYMGNAYANNGVVNSLAGGQLTKPNNLAMNTRTNAYSAWG